MAEEALRSTNLKVNFHRLTRLLMRGGVNLLRETFDSIHSPADLPLRLADPAVQVQLRGARLTQPERACLYPSPGMYGKSNDFDITLIFKLLRTICNLTPPPGPRGWDDLPNGSDHTLVADLVRIKYYRNEIHGHRHSMEISDTEFVRLWEEISKALLRIATNISPAKRDEWKKSINDLLFKSLTQDEKRCIEELETWYMQDLEVKNEVVKLREDIGSLTDTTAAVLAILINVLGPNAAGSEPLVPVPQQAEGADDPEASNPLLPEPEQAEGADDPELNNPIYPPDIDVWDVILSFKEAVDLFLRYLSSKLHLRVRSKGRGSWHITVECSSSQDLEGLWEDYRSGHLNSVAQEMLITQQVLEKLGLTELKLRTFISEDQYEKGKKLLEASSGAEYKSEIQSAFQATITETTSEGSIEPDLLARISKLERENVELKEKVKAIHGIFRSERDLLVRIPTIERENVTLKAKVKAMEETFGRERNLLARIPTIERENVTLKAKVKAMEETFGSERNPLAGVSTSERENVELMEKVKAMEETLGSEREGYFDERMLHLKMRNPDAAGSFRQGQFSSGEEFSPRWRRRPRRQGGPLPSVGVGIYSGQRYGFCQVIINRTTQEELVGQKDEIVHVFKMLNYRVDKATCTPSDDLKELVQSIVARDYEHCDIFVCFILSNLSENTEMESVKGGAFNVRDLMDMFSPPNCPKLAGKPKVFIFLVHQKAAASESKYSIAEKLITEVPFYGLCLFVPYGKGYLSALLNEIMSRSLHLDLLTILKEAKKSFYKKTKITIPDPVHNFRGEVFLAV